MIIRYRGKIVHCYKIRGRAIQCSFYVYLKILFDRRFRESIAVLGKDFDDKIGSAVYYTLKTTAEVTKSSKRLSPIDNRK